jgi:hypothetical protein
MQAMASKAERMAALVHHLVKAPSVLFGDATLYFKEMRDVLEHPYYPEISLGWRERKPELLSVTDTYMDYSLHELPMADDAADADTNENPNAASLPQAVVNRTNEPETPDRSVVHRGEENIADLLILNPEVMPGGAATAVRAGRTGCRLRLWWRP